MYASLVSLLYACDAPRDNPLDPEADNFIGLRGSIAGKVTNLISAPVTDALVLTIPGCRGAFTDSLGNYIIEDVETDVDSRDYQIFCAPSGFEPDTLSVTVYPGSLAVRDFRLDALPVIQDFQVTSHYIYQPGETPPDYYTIFARSHLTDPEGLGDIKIVLLKVEGDPDTLMSYDPDSSTGSSFFYFVNLYFLPFEVDSLKLKHFTCLVEDTSGNTTSSLPLSIMRFFVTSPILIYPDPLNHQIITTPFPTLVWYPFEGQFFYTHTARIFRELSTYNELVWQRSGIASYVDTATVDDSLSSDDYYWELEVYDEYGNSSRSEPAYFEVHL